MCLISFYIVCKRQEGSDDGSLHFLHPPTRVCRAQDLQQSHFLCCLGVAISIYGTESSRLECQGGVISYIGSGCQSTPLHFDDLENLVRWG